MTPLDENPEFWRLNATIGKDKALVQGTGGNSSLKIGQVMYIKASGEYMHTMSPTSCSRLQFKDIADAHLTACADESIRGLLKTDNLTPDLKPSMEFGFHTFLEKYVFHLHPVNANALLCSIQGELILKKAFRSTEALWVPYAKPGHALATTIASMCKDLNNIPGVIFLQNHGMIFHHHSLTGVENLITDTLDRVDKCLCPISKETPHFIYEELKKDRLFNKSIYLQELFAGEDDFRFAYPDAVVFLQDMLLGKGPARFKDGEIRYESLTKATKCIDEVISSYAYTLSIMRKCGLSPRFLLDRQVAEIQNMPEEIYRQMKIGIRK
jgi:ribulose-5-phosphate 4-epimerase/fuculose-1-phosphate aldolase